MWRQGRRKELWNAISVPFLPQCHTAMPFLLLLCFVKASLIIPAWVRCNIKPSAIRPFASMFTFRAPKDVSVQPSISDRQTVADPFRPQTSSYATSQISEVYFFCIHFKERWWVGVGVGGESLVCISSPNWHGANKRRVIHWRSCCHYSGQDLTNLLWRGPSCRRLGFASDNCVEMYLLVFC